VPESRIRRRAAWTAPAAPKAGPGPSPRWWVPVMLALMVLGLVWIVAFYLMGSDGPVPHLGAWNLAAGFALILVGFAMTTRWR
jgi:Cell division protein CrgA